MPSFDIVSFGGLGASNVGFFLVGFSQYRSKTPSLSHLCRDCSIDAANTPLNVVSIKAQKTREVLTSQRWSGIPELTDSDLVVQGELAGGVDL